MHPSSSLVSWLVWELVISLVAASGGIVVFWGLWMENKVAKEMYRDVQDMRASRRTAHRGWTVLMVGIGIEIVVAFAFAARDGWEIRQIERQVATNSPLNQPVTEITASARFLWRSTNDWGPIGYPQENRIELMENIGKKTLYLGGFGTLIENEGWPYKESDNSGSYLGAYLTFRPDRTLQFPSAIVLSDMSPATPRQVLDNIGIVAFTFASVPKDMEVFRGALELKVNEFSKQFQIPPQRPDTNGIFYATNLAQPF